MAEVLRLISLNCRGLRNHEKRTTLFRIAKELRAQIILLQETHFIQNDIDELRIQWGKNMYHSYGTNRARGTSILVSDDCNENVQELYVDDEGRVVVIEIVKGNLELALANVYAPNVDDPKFFSNVINTLEQSFCAEKMIMGDFNMVLNPEIDRTENTQYAPEAFEILNKYMIDSHLIDLWRNRHKTERYYSWHRTKPSFTGSRLDNCISSESLENRTKSIDYQHVSISDHSMLKVDIMLPMHARGPGFWRLNTQLLNNEHLIRELRLFTQCL